jgi:hypothetical protein
MNEIDIDIEAQERESKRLLEEQERRIAEQEHEATAMQQLQRQNKSGIS